MKICIFGADGRTGVDVVNYAQSKGYDIVAFVYSNNSNKHFPSNVLIQQGDVMNYEHVVNALKDTNVVISVLGHIKGSDPFMQTKGMRNIVRAMNELGISRILSLTGTGVRVTGDTPSIIDKILNYIIVRIDPDRITDGIEHVRVLKESGLDFTVVRVLKLSKNSSSFGAYKLTDGGPAELQTSRKKVAHILVDLIDDQTYFRKFPVVSRL